MAFGDTAADRYYLMKWKEFHRMVNPQAYNASSPFGPINERKVTDADVQAWIMSTGGNPYAKRSKANSGYEQGPHPYQMIGTPAYKEARRQQRNSERDSRAGMRFVQSQQGDNDTDKLAELLEERDRLRAEEEENRTPTGRGDSPFSAPDAFRNMMRTYEERGLVEPEEPYQDRVPMGNPYADPYRQLSDNQQRVSDLQTKLNDEYQRKMDEANAANEERYQELVGQSADLRGRALKEVETLGQSQLSDIDDSYRKASQGAYQNLASRGLTGTTVVPAIQQTLEEERQQQRRRAVDDITRRRVESDVNLTNNMLGIMERRTDAQPDFNQLVALQQGIGQGGNGMYGYGYQNQTPFLGQQQQLQRQQQNMAPPNPNQGNAYQTGNYGLPPRPNQQMNQGYNAYAGYQGQMDGGNVFLGQQPTGPRNVTTGMGGGGGGKAGGYYLGGSTGGSFQMPGSFQRYQEEQRRKQQQAAQQRMLGMRQRQGMYGTVVGGAAPPVDDGRYPRFETYGAGSGNIYHRGGGRQYYAPQMLGG